MRCDARGLVHVHVHDQPVHHARNVQNVEAHDREEALHLASRIENLGQGKKPDHDHDWTVSPVGVPTSHHNQFVSGVCSTSTAAATSRLHDESLESRRPIKVPDLSKPPPCHKFSDLDSWTQNWLRIHKNETLRKEAHSSGQSTSSKISPTSIDVSFTHSVSKKICKKRKDE